ncbi:MAG TPA: protein kinase [Polyangia bacterium]|nr:protein kinase [Polyangia bacterium]
MAGLCLGEDSVLAFVDGTLPHAGRAAVEEHLDGCPLCMDLVTWAAAEVRDETRPVSQPCPPPAAILQRGTRVARYVILSAAGRGGMGEVYAAYHPDLDRRIALKIVQDRGSDTSEAGKRMLREARAIARLSHPNVVTVHDAGALDDRLYIAMEFVDGPTVHDWLRSQRRSWKQVLNVFLAAGRGLAAAHSANIVHRDFKPQNLLIGPDGVVRVTDFGLAQVRPNERELAALVGETQAVDVLTTAAGTLLGTPAYMAPEQFRREPTDKRADQFSFCVALHEALYGCRPVLPHLRQPSGTTRPTLLPAEGTIPARFRRIIARGLEPDRARRYPSMDDLLSTLSRAVHAGRRRAIIFGVAAATLVAAAGVTRIERQTRSVCRLPDARIARAWPTAQDDPRRQAVHGAFVSRALLGSERAWQAFSQFLDQYVHDWSDMYMQACEATNVYGGQSSQGLDLRMGCLADALDQVRALTTVVAEGDAASVRNAQVTLHNLTPLSRCADLNLLRSEAPLPADPGTAAAVQTIRARMRDALALLEVGNLTGAERLAGLIVPDAERAGDDLTLAEVLAVLGRAQGMVNPRQSQQTLRRAFALAVPSRDYVLLAKILSPLIYVETYTGRFELAEVWAEMADELTAHLPAGAERFKAWVLNDESLLASEEGSSERALTLVRESIEIKRRTLPPDHPDLAASLSNEALWMNEARRYSEAMPLTTEALHILEACCDHTAILANTYSLRAESLLGLGQFEAAEAASNKAESNVSEAPEQFGVYLADARANRGAARLGQGDVPGGLALLESAFALAKTASASRRQRAWLGRIEFLLAQALAESGHRRRALTLAQDAQQAFTATGRSIQAEMAKAWMARQETRRRPPRRVRLAERSDDRVRRP